MLIEIIGWLAGICFAFCGFPQALLSYKQGHSKGVSEPFLWLWMGGEVLMTVYVMNKHGWDLPLLLNYWVNGAFLCMIMKYKYFPRVK